MIKPRLTCSSLERHRYSDSESPVELHKYIAKKFLNYSLTARNNIIDSKTYKGVSRSKQSCEIPSSTFQSITKEAEISSVEDFITKLNKLFQKVSEERPQLKEGYSKLMESFKKFDFKATIDRNRVTPNEHYMPTSYHEYNKTTFKDLLKQQPEERIRSLEKSLKECKNIIEKLDKDLRDKAQECDHALYQIKQCQVQIYQSNATIVEKDAIIERLKEQINNNTAIYLEKELSLKHSLQLLAFEKDQHVKAIQSDTAKGNVML